MITALLFLGHGGLLIISGIAVIGAKNPVHAVLFLILAFFNTSSLLLMLQAEFLAIVFLIIYVGAIAILFLFVVMMLNVKITLANVNLLRYLPIGGVILLVFVTQLFLLLTQTTTGLSGNRTLSLTTATDWPEILNVLTQVESIGMVMYTKFSDVFIISSIILLVAMIGAIMLTLRPVENVRQRDISHQLQTKSTTFWYY